MKWTSSRIILVIGLALLLRSVPVAVAAYFPERALVPDSDSYVQPALYFLGQDSEVPSALRTPVYPLFIAMIYLFFGETNEAIVFAQVIVGVLTVYLTYLLGRQLCPPSTALLGAFLAAFSLDLMISSFFVIAETLFTLLLTGSLLLLVFYLRREQTLLLVLSAVAMGLAILCRPVATLFPVVMGFSILVFSPRPFLVRIKDTLVLMLVLGLVMLPWVVRNYRLIGVPVISTIASYNLLYNNAVSLEAARRNLDEREVHDEMGDRVSEALARSGLSDTAGNRSRAQSALAREIIMQSPGRYLLLHLRRDLNSLLPPVSDVMQIAGLRSGGRGTLRVLNQHGLIRAVNHYFEGQTWLIWMFLPVIGMLILLYLGCVVGAWALWRDRHWLPLALLVLPICYFLLIPGAPSLPRFRWPVMPLMSILGAIGLIESWRSFFRRGETGQ